MGKSGEEDLPQTGAGGETSAGTELALRCIRKHLDVNLEFYHLDHSLSSFKL